MSTNTEHLEALLKLHGYSLTRPRKLLFTALQNSEPLTMHELITACKSAIDKSSAYRTIALFERLGIVQRLQIGWKYKLELSNNFQTHHHHATCLGCGKVLQLPEDTAIEERLRQLSADFKFTPSDHQLEIRGTCQNCTV